MTSWYADLGSDERRTLWACFGGWALDAFDLQVYTFAIPTLLGLWGISKGQAGALQTAALLLSAFGGWIAGILSDRFGRVRILQVTIVWFAAFTFLSGFTENFQQLFVCRALQGLGFGGEWAAGAVLIGEVIRGDYRGRAVGTVQSGYAVGWGVAALLSGLIFGTFPKDTAWRVMFWIGILPAGLVFYVRRFVHEPAVFQRAKRPPNAGFFALIIPFFSTEYWTTTIKAVLLTTGATGGFYAFGTWLPSYLQMTRGLSVFNSSGYLTVLIVGGFIGFILGAYLADYIGRRSTFLLFAVCAAIMIFTYMFVPITDRMMLVLGFPLGLFSNGLFAPMGPFLSELFPTGIRATAQGFTYNAGRAVGSLFPWLVGKLSETLPLGQAIGIFSAACYGVLIIGCLMLPETKGRQLIA